MQEAASLEIACVTEQPWNKQEIEKAIQAPGAVTNTG